MTEPVYLEIDTTDLEMREALWALKNDPEAEGIELTEIMKKADQAERIHEIMLIAKTGIEIVGGLAGVLLIVKKFMAKNGKTTTIRFRATSKTADLVSAQLKEIGVEFSYESKPVPASIDAAVDEHYAEARAFADAYLAKQKAEANPPE